MFDLEAAREDITNFDPPEAEFSTKLLDEIEQLQVEIKKLKSTCICLDCGKIIRTVEQSKHSIKCKRQSKP